MNNPEFVSYSDKDTRRFAEKLARRLKKNDCLALTGCFGSGKTTFVKGLVRGLGLKEDSAVSSPSFVIMKIYQARLPVYHFDLYRLDGIADLETVGFDEFINAGGITVIEWADKIKDYLPKGALRVSFAVLGPQKRRLKFSVKDKKVKSAIEGIIGVHSA